MAGSAALSDEALPDVLACLMVPLQRQKLLLPSVAIAEIIPFVKPEAIENAPSWLLGNFTWRSQRLSLINFENLTGSFLGEKGAPSRIAVLNRSGVHQDITFLGMVTYGIPRLTQVSVEDCVATDSETDRSCELANIYCQGEPAVIPDISTLESEYLKYFRS